MSFYIGQKVVCVDNKHIVGSLIEGKVYPVKDFIYCVCGCYSHGSVWVGLFVDEIKEYKCQKCGMHYETSNRQLNPQYKFAPVEHQEAVEELLNTEPIRINK